MLYTILEVSKKLNTSKVTVYKKINSVNKLKGFITIKNNVKYINDEGLEVLKELINKSVNSKDCKWVNLNDDKNTIKASEYNAFNYLQEDYISTLKKQIEEKDRQLEEKDRIIKKQMELNENNQILLRQEKERLMIMESNNNKSFWRKIFK